LDSSKLAVVDHLWEKFVGAKKEGLESEQDETSVEVKLIEEISEIQRTTIKLCTVPRSLTELQNNLGFSNRTHFKRKTLDPLIDGGLVNMTNPDKPKASNQKYAVSEGGFRLLEVWEKSSD
jgi:hypothetical protein